MLTQSNVKALKENLENTLVICNEMIRTREINKLFTSEKDFRDSKIARELIPCDYYNFRCFDVKIELSYSSKLKCYLIKFDDVFKYIEYGNLYKNFKDYISDDLSFSKYEQKIILKKDINFEGAVEIFKRVCIYFCSKTIDKDKLFEIF